MVRACNVAHTCDTACCQRAAASACSTLLGFKNEKHEPGSRCNGNANSSATVACMAAQPPASCRCSAANSSMPFQQFGIGLCTVASMLLQPIAWLTSRRAGSQCNLRHAHISAASACMAGFGLCTPVPLLLQSTAWLTNRRAGSRCPCRCDANGSAGSTCVAGDEPANAAVGAVISWLHLLTSRREGSQCL